MVYSTFADVNLLTNITANDVANADVTSLIAYATYQLNHDINVKIIRERVEYIDSTRENNIDSSNTIFYIRNWKGNYLADLNDDGDIDTSDVIAHLVSTDGTETTATVSSIDESGKVTLSAAPTSDQEVYLTYAYSRVSENGSNCHPLVKMACVYLTAYLCYGKIMLGKSPTVSFGNTRLVRNMSSANEYFQRYQLIVKQINDTQADIKKAEEI